MNDKPQYEPDWTPLDYVIAYSVLIAVFGFLFWLVFRIFFVVT